MFSIYFTEAFRNLYTARQRTLLALLGIIIGIGAMIGQVSISMIKGAETLREFSQMGTDVMVFRKDYSGDENNNTQISIAEALELPRYVPSVVTVAPMMQGQGEYRFAGETSGTDILGVNTSLPAVSKGFQLEEGRFFSNLDRDDNLSYAVIGCEVREWPGFKDFQGKLLGAEIKLNGYSYVIIGVLKCTEDYFIYPINWSILLPISSLQRQFYVTAVERLVVRRVADSNHLLVSAQIKQYFAKRVKGLKVRRLEGYDNWIKQEKKEVRRMTLLSIAIGGLSLLAGSIGIMNVMLTAVIERRREIGILRAIGARQRDIRWQFLLEAIILSLLGGILGSGLGIASSYLIAWWNEWQFFVSYQVLLLGVGVSWGVGIFFGFYPAYKAAKLDPIVALRTE